MGSRYFFYPNNYNRFCIEITTEFYEKYLKEYENCFQNRLINLDTLKPFYPAGQNIVILEEALITDDYAAALNYILNNNYSEIQQFFENKTRDQAIIELVQKINYLDTDNTEVSFTTRIYLESYGKYKFKKIDPNLKLIAEYIIYEYFSSLNYKPSSFPFKLTNFLDSKNNYHILSIYIEFMKIFLSKSHYEEHKDELMPYIEKGEKILELFKSIG
jgi:hypothetical protein